MDFFNHIFDTNFWQNFVQLNNNPWRIFISLLDLSIVAFIVYRIIKFVQGTRLMILVRGVVVFIILYVLAGVLGLSTFRWLLSQVIAYGAIAMIIIFQPEIRQALERLGRTTHVFSGKSPSALDNHLLAYERSFEYMSKRKIGALIAIERVQTLDEYADSGIKLDADISSELIINIFIPNTPLHDGAVIVQDGKITVTSAYLPLTDKLGISKQFGTRHRAAIGLSEVSDAVILVVSEETGGISLAVNGELKADLNSEEFHETLVKELLEPDRSDQGGWFTLPAWLTKKEGKKTGKKK